MDAMFTELAKMIQHTVILQLCFPSLYIYDHLCIIDLELFTFYMYTRHTYLILPFHKSIFAPPDIHVTHDLFPTV